MNDKKTDEKEAKKFEITPEILEDLLSGKLLSADKAVSYLINQLRATKQQFEQVVPQLKQKEKELTELRKALDMLANRFDSLQLDICNLWPN